MGSSVDWFKAQKMYQNGGATLEEIAKRVGRSRQEVSKRVDKDNTFALHKLQVFYEKLVLLSDAKVANSTGYSKQCTRHWFDKMFTIMPYSQAIRCNGLGAIGDYVRKNKAQKENILEELLTVDKLTGKRRLELMISAQNKQVPDCYSDRALNKSSYTDSLYQLEEELNQYDLADERLGEMDEIDLICRDYYSGQLNQVDISRSLMPLTELSPKGILHSLTEMSDFSLALQSLPAEHRVVINLHYGELTNVAFEELWRAKEAMRVALGPLLEYSR